MPFVNFARISTEHTRKQIFLMSYSKIFFQNLHFGPITVDGFLDDFWKFRFFIVKICILIWYCWVFFENYSMCVCWAYAEPISSHTEERISAHAQPAVRCEQFYMYNPCWAYAERILSHTEHTWNEFFSHAEHTRKCLKVKYLGRIEISCFRPLEPYGFGFCKKSIKKFHACVPLSNPVFWSRFLYWLIVSVNSRSDCFSVFIVTLNFSYIFPPLTYNEWM